MNHSTLSRMRAVLAAVAFACAAAGGAVAHEQELGHLMVIHPTAPALPGPTAAVYMAIANDGKRPDRLVGVATPVARRAEVHRSEMDGDIMRMRHVETVDLPAGDTVNFEPGGMHIMLVGLKKPLKDGDEFPMMLTFENDRRLQITVKVEGRPGGAPGHGKH